MSSLLPCSFTKDSDLRRTDTITYLHAGHPRVIKHLSELADPDVGTTIITKIELLRGRFEHVLYEEARD